MTFRRIAAVLAMLQPLGVMGPVFAQQSVEQDTMTPQHALVVGQDSLQIHPVRLAIVGGITAATVVGVHLYQQKAWWQGPRAPFRFANDWDYAMNVDKQGHAYGAYLLAHLFGYALRWGGEDRASSTLYGSLFGLGYQLYVEVEDGFHKEYGFSPGDAISDVAGASVPLLQESFPALKSFALKWSYYPSQEYLDALKREQSRVFIDDYEGQLYWYSWTPRAMFDGPGVAWVPEWLGLSVGFGARQLYDASLRHRVIAVTFDVSLSRIHTGSDFVDAILTALDHIHVPAPGFIVERGTVTFGVIY